MLKLRLLLSFLLTGAIMLVAAAPGRADSAAAILAQHFAYVGWSGGAPPFHSLVTEIKIFNKSGKLQYAGQIRYLGLAYREDTRSVRTGRENSKGFTGTIAWQTDSNGFTTPQLGDSARLAIDRDIIFSEAYSSFPASVRPALRVAGVRYPVIRISPQHLPSFDLAFNPENGALVQATIAPDTDFTEVLQVDAYSEVLPGKRMISAFHFQSYGYRYKLSEFQPNVSLPVDEVEPPSQTATWTYANPNPFPISITQHRVLVKASVNGVPGTFIIDSGADGIVFSRKFAKAAHLTDVGHATAEGVAGASQESLVRVKSIDIGGNTLSNVNASSMNGNGLGADGLIGFPLFADAVTTIDFTNGTLQLQDPNQTHPSKLAGIHAIIDLSSGIPQVPMKIDGRIPVDTFLDTGDPYLVLIPKSLVFQEHLTMLVDNTLGGYFSSHVAVGGVGGRYQIGHCGRLDSIAFGQIVYQNPKTCETTSFIGYRALVGLDFLRHFKRIIFDYPQSRMIFVPKV
ncbi:MAG: hypothetical protein HKL91_06180 [Candidatus Eremiobacteraeota bacterium]|uniref:Peptidase A2 domain-containing protein n=1 Tax=mine drainage metagenome TaxID=410659 RepID=A0A3P3ZNK6_9ZZZZ|nr:hypothetical protein [Candidatus Eremiobacteraeota bacterium]